jgi:hypothetical protein
MSDRAILIRLAASLPVGDASRHAILDFLQGNRFASLDKAALAADTEDFIEWVLATKQDSKLSESAAQRFLEAKAKREPSQPAAPGESTRKTGPLGKGELVSVDASKNTNPMNVDACDRFNGKVATITDVTADGLLLAFHKGDVASFSDDLTGQTALFNGFASGKATGLYRYTPKSVVVENATGSGVLFEVVYLRAGEKVDSTRAEQIESYVDRGSMIGESRSRVYYTGSLGKFAFNQQGELYFGLVAQQRDTAMTFINPVKGKLLYLGVAGQRPKGWKDEAIQLGIMLP